MGRLLNMKLLSLLNSQELGTYLIDGPGFVYQKRFNQVWMRLRGSRSRDTAFLNSGQLCDLLAKNPRPWALM